MTKDQAIKKQIKEVVAIFDWEEAHKMMVATNWEWFMDGEMRVPSIGEMITQAIDMMEDSAKRGNRVNSTGGLTVLKDEGDGEDGPWIRMVLYFGPQSLNDATDYSVEA